MYKKVQFLKKINNTAIMPSKSAENAPMTRNYDCGEG
jgi:hypothetical protein